MTRDGEWEAFLRGLTMERYQHVPEAGVPVEGPTSAWMAEQRRVAAETADVVVVLPRLENHVDLSTVFHDVNEDRRHA